MSRLLLDANLSPALAEALRRRGHDAVHVNDLGMRTATDVEILDRASALHRAVVTEDNDFLRLLGTRRAVSPSVVLMSQREKQRDPAAGHLAQAMQLAVALTELEGRLERGVAVRLHAGGERIDPLPLARRSAERRTERVREPRGRSLPSLGLER